VPALPAISLRSRRLGTEVIGPRQHFTVAPDDHHPDPTSLPRPTVETIPQRTPVGVQRTHEDPGLVAVRDPRARTAGYQACVVTSCGWPRRHQMTLVRCAGPRRLMWSGALGVGTWCSCWEPRPGGGIFSSGPTLACRGSLPQVYTAIMSTARTIDSPPASMGGAHQTLGDGSHRSRHRTGHLPRRRAVQQSPPGKDAGLDRKHHPAGGPRPAVLRWEETGSGPARRTRPPPHVPAGRQRRLSQQ